MTFVAANLVALDSAGYYGKVIRLSHAPQMHFDQNFCGSGSENRGFACR